MRFRDLPIGKKQMIGFGVILFIMAIANVFAISNLGSLERNIDEISNNWLPRSLLISDIRLNTSTLRIQQMYYAVAKDPAQKDFYRGQMHELITRIDENRDKYETLRDVSDAMHSFSEKEGELYDSYDTYWEAYLDYSFEFLELADKSTQEAALNLHAGQARDIYDVMVNGLDSLRAISEEDARTAAVRAEYTYKRTRLVSNILLIAAILLSAFIAGMLVRSVMVPIRELELAASRVSAGDLQIQIEVPGRDEIGNLAASFNHMTSSLRDATDKMHKQAEVLRENQIVLEKTNQELATKSETLEQQRDEIEAKNLKLEEAMQDLRMTQEQLLMSEKMAALGDLIAGVAHEINNPMGVINSASDISRRCVSRMKEMARAAGQDDIRISAAAMQKMLRILEENVKVSLQAGDRIIQLVRSLKNFANLDEADYQRVNIHEGIESSLTLLGAEVQQRIRILRDFGDIPKIECYPGQLNQVFLNLLRNATQAIEGKGEIAIYTAANNGHIHVVFKDTGVGISQERLAHIFDFGFSRKGERVKMSSGLTSAFNIIQRHKGRINIESEVGVGTTVRIQLPLS